MIKLLIISIFLLNTNPISLYAQVTQEWAVTYDGFNQIDEAVDLAVDGSGNIYVTGKSYRDSSDYDYSTIKYNNAGVIQWVQRYNGSANSDDHPSKIAIDGSGNVYIAGSSSQGGSGYNFTTLKYNTNGVQMWLQNFYGTGNLGGFASSIAVYGSGIVYVTGTVDNLNTSIDCATIKYNSLGLPQWIEQLSGYNNIDDQANGLVLDNSGNAYITGYISNYNQNGYDYLTVKYNSSGNLLWSQAYNGPVNGFDFAYAVAVDNSGNVYVTGGSFGNFSFYDIATVKYSPTGVFQWAKRYNGIGNGNAAANSIILDDSANVYVTGYNTGTVAGDIVTIKYNTNGVQLWVKIYNGPANGNDFSTSITSDSAKNIYVTGASEGIGSGSDIVTIKYSPAGDELWVERFNGAANSVDSPVGIKIDRNNNVFVTGKSYLTNSSFDYVTIKYSQVVGINLISNEIPVSNHLEQNYPNPFNPATVIRYSIIENVFVKLKLYDILGNEIATLVNEKQNAGSYNYQFSTVNYQLSSGIYFYKLEAGDFVETRRMILLK